MLTEPVLIENVVVSLDGDLLLSACHDGTVKLWSLTRGECVQTFVGHAGAVNSVAFSRNGLLVLTASQDRTAKAWSMDGGVCIKSFAHEYGVEEAELPQIFWWCSPRVLMTK